MRPYKARIGTTPWKLIHGEKMDLSRFRTFGCRAWVHFNSERREKGKHTQQAIEVIYLGFQPNTSSWSFFIPKRNTMISPNQAQFDKRIFPFRNREMIEKYQSDQATDILFRKESTYSDVKWIPYNQLHISNDTRVHFDQASDMMLMRVNTETNSFTRVTQLKWLRDKMALVI